MITKKHVKQALYDDLKEKLDNGKIIGGINSIHSELIDCYCTKDTFNEAIKQFAKYFVIFNDEENTLVIEAKKKKEKLNTQYYHITYDDWIHSIFVTGENNVRNLYLIYNITDSINKIVDDVNNDKLNLLCVEISQNNILR